MYLAYWWTRVWRPTAHRLPPERQPLAIRRYRTLTLPRDQWLAELRAQPLPPAAPVRRDPPPGRGQPSRREPPGRVRVPPQAGPTATPRSPARADRSATPREPARADPRATPSATPRAPAQKRAASKAARPAAGKAAAPTAGKAAAPAAGKAAAPAADKAGNAGKAAPPKPPTPPEERSITSTHVSIAVQRSGLVIRRRAGYTGWLPICDLGWADIIALELDSGIHDAARMLYASVRSSPVRKPLIDQAHLTPEQWFELRDSVAEWTGQSVLINLAHLRVTDRARPYDEL